MSFEDLTLFCRTFSARPIISSDEHGATKFKMERFLQPGQNAIATVYGPITYSPLPLLALSRVSESGPYEVAAAGMHWHLLRLILCIWVSHALRRLQHILLQGAKNSSFLTLSQGRKPNDGRSARHC